MGDTSTRVEIIQRENKTSTVLTVRNMDTSQKNVYARRGTSNNARTTKIRVTKKMSDIRNKNITNKRKSKGKCSSRDSSRRAIFWR